MISLADLRARDVTPVWQEAVAVVQELIQTVKATTGSAELLPDLEHIALIPNGDVVAMPGSPEPGSPVRHAAVMLRLLLEGAPAPPELEAFIERNVADPPQYHSVNEFSRNLAFFERPGRRADVERLVGRAMAAEQTRRADEELRRLKERATEVESAAPAADFMQEPRRLRTIPVPLVAALLVLALGGAAWLWMRSGTEPVAGTAAAEDSTATSGEANPAESAATDDANAPGATAATAPAMAPNTAPVNEAAPGANGTGQPAQRSLLTRTTDAVRTAVTSLLGSDEPKPAAASKPVEPEQPEPASRAPGRTTSRPAAAATNAARPTASPSPAPAATASAAPAAAARDAAAPVLPPATIARATEAPEAATIFTAMDTAVMPPVLVRPVLPKEPPPNVPPENIGTIEVLVDEQGDVLSVKLISPANRYHERMLVSAAKMWKFRPAYKDGHPVRYRTRVRLTI